MAGEAPPVWHFPPVSADSDSDDSQSAREASHSRTLRRACDASGYVPHVWKAGGQVPVPPLPQPPLRLTYPTMFQDELEAAAH